MGTICSLRDSQAVIGLNHIHSKRILHRDIKSHNIFLDHDFNIKAIRASSPLSPS